MTVDASKLAVLTALIHNLEQYLQELQGEVISVYIDHERNAGKDYYHGRVHWWGDPVALHDLVSGGPVRLERALFAAQPYRWEFDGLGIRWVGYCDVNTAELLMAKTGEAPAAATAEAR